ncbi:hypothetical protein KIN20_024735 [Parelaphostrongylus tenuis]|uniref:Uncharacterized protein n=1 Tax=Parelaphostrongylus tenuis TaxID=148309 RepID=A0AAD5N7X7_PARTN|nr:hypothetical protein KIN20_024735 [Parelaphostrongylus tenuis]
MLDDMRNCELRSGVEIASHPLGAIEEGLLAERESRWVVDGRRPLEEELARIRCADHQFADLPPQMTSFLEEADLFLSLPELFVEMTVAPQRHAQIVLSIRSVTTEAKRKSIVIYRKCFRIYS